MTMMVTAVAAVAAMQQVEWKRESLRKNVCTKRICEEKRFDIGLSAVQQSTLFICLGVKTFVCDVIFIIKFIDYRRSRVRNKSTLVSFYVYLNILRPLESFTRNQHFISIESKRTRSVKGRGGRKRREEERSNIKAKMVYFDEIENSSHIRKLHLGFTSLQIYFNPFYDKASKVKKKHDHKMVNDINFLWSIEKTKIENFAHSFCL